MGGSLLVVDDIRQVGVPAEGLLVELLGYLDRWRTIGAIRRRFPLTGTSVSTLVKELLNNSFIEAQDSRQPSRADWKDWSPLASSFYFGTKDTVFPRDAVRAERQFQQRMAKLPALTSARRHTPYFKLPSAANTPLSNTLAARRTWRRFGRAQVTLEQISTLMGHCFGAQGWVESPAGVSPLRSAPSGGACHPIEAYLASRSIRGLASGLYHYDSGTHEFSRITEPLTTRHLKAFMPSQPWFWRASCWVILTARFERTMRRYPSSRAFRNVLLEAGHFGQSFCLQATDMGLAPFCTHAVVDSTVEKALGLDGVSEGVVYVLGCGSQPATGWAPDVPGVGRARWIRRGR